MSWKLIETAPEDDHQRWVHVAAQGGLPSFQCWCNWHPDAGYCVDEIRPVTHWWDGPIGTNNYPIPPDVPNLTNVIRDDIKDEFRNQVKYTSLKTVEEIAASVIAKATDEILDSLEKQAVDAIKYAIGEEQQNIYNLIDVVPTTTDGGRAMKEAILALIRIRREENEQAPTERLDKIKDYTKKGDYPESLSIEDCKFLLERASQCTYLEKRVSEDLKRMESLVTELKIARFEAVGFVENTLTGDLGP